MPEIRKFAHLVDINFLRIKLSQQPEIFTIQIIFSCTFAWKLHEMAVGHKIPAEKYSITAVQFYRVMLMLRSLKK